MLLWSGTLQLLKDLHKRCALSFSASVAHVRSAVPAEGAIDSWRQFHWPIPPPPK
jgi:hypothetical protein